MPENRQKIKLLLLWNLLLDQSDEQHPLTTKEILQMLQDQNVDCERRTLSKDIDLLNEEGFEVLSAFIGSTKAYYVEDRQFSVPELQILIDAIKAAQFITPKKKRRTYFKNRFIGRCALQGILTKRSAFFCTAPSIPTKSSTMPSMP
jgi:hypothetical protein